MNHRQQHQRQQGSGSSSPMSRGDDRGGSCNTSGVGIAADDHHQHNSSRGSRRHGGCSGGFNNDNDNNNNCTSPSGSTRATTTTSRVAAVPHHYNKYDNIYSSLLPHSLQQEQNQDSNAANYYPHHHQKQRNRERQLLRARITMIVYIVVLSFLLILQVIQMLPSSKDDGGNNNSIQLVQIPRQRQRQQTPRQRESASSALSASTAADKRQQQRRIDLMMMNNNNIHSPLSVPTGIAEALPALPAEDEEQRQDQQQLEEQPEQQNNRPQEILRGMSPAVMKLLIQEVGIHSVVDVSCHVGMGLTASWLIHHGVSDTLCVVPQAEAVDSLSTNSNRKKNRDPTMIHIIREHPQEHVGGSVIAHDYTRGPWWPSSANNDTTTTSGTTATTKTYDAAWMIDLAQDLPYSTLMSNVMPTLRSAALIFMTTSNLPGHLEVHDDEWWIRKMAHHAGLVYDEALTNRIRTAAYVEHLQSISSPLGISYNAQSLWISLKVFLNPAVAAGHLHLFPEKGCVTRRKDPRTGKWIRRDCGTGTGNNKDAADAEIPTTDPLYMPLPLHLSQDDAWFDLVHHYGLQHNITSTTTLRGKTTLPTGDQDEVEGEGGAVDSEKNETVLTPYEKYEQELIQTVEAEFAKRPYIRKILQQMQAKRAEREHGMDGSDGGEGGDGVIPRSLLNKPPPPARQQRVFETVPVPVVVWPYVELGIGTAESLHAEENGIQESLFLQLATHMYDVTPGVVWVGDTGYGYGWNLWCNAFLERITKVQEYRLARNLTLQWPIYIIDFTDQHQRQRCRQVERAMGNQQGWVTYHKRALTEGRSWNNVTNWVNTGYRRPITNLHNITYYPNPLFVRTDTIETIQEVLQNDYEGVTLADDLSTPPPEDAVALGRGGYLPRPVDATHFWPLHQKGVNIIYANLRNRVSTVMDEFRTEQEQQHGRQYNIFIGLKGSAIRRGRRNVMREYIQSLLETKIVVVTQRDIWEDHYRLFEALAAGCMVLTDRMLALPAGLQNGTSLVEYTSPEDLKQKLSHYLEHPQERVSIAVRGRLVAMRRHRTWHRMEQVIFGRVKSDCKETAKLKPDTKCPYIAHATD